MQYIAVNNPGGPEVMHLAEMEAPTPAPGQVLIKVAAAGINRPDIMQRRGLYPPPENASPVMGLEVAGEIIALGANVDDHWLHQPVCALVNGGGYAEQVVVPVDQCLPFPSGWSATEAATLPETFFTVWSNVYDRGKLAPGETLLVHGGSSGIGSAAIQMATAMGAKVYTTAGTQAKCDYCEQLGAVKAINYREQDFVTELLSATNNKGIDVTLDMVGGDYMNRNIQLAALQGRIVYIAFLKGPQAEVNFLPLMLKRLILTGSTLRPRTHTEKAAIARNLREHIWPKLDAGLIKPTIAATFPFAEVAAAHRLMESGEHMGNIVLTFS